MKITESKLRSMVRGMLKEQTSTPIKGLYAGLEGGGVYFVLNGKKMGPEEFMTELKVFLQGQ